MRYVFILYRVCNTFFSTPGESIEEHFQHEFAVQRDWLLEQHACGAAHLLEHVPQVTEDLLRSPFL